MSERRLGATIHRMREERGLTQLGLAKRARVSQAYLSQLEAGQKSNPAVAIVQRLARALGVPIQDLVR